MGPVEWMNPANLWLVPVIMLITAASVAVIVTGVGLMGVLFVKLWRAITGKRDEPEREN